MPRSKKVQPIEEYNSSADKVPVPKKEKKPRVSKKPALMEEEAEPASDHPNQRYIYHEDDECYFDSGSETTPSTPPSSPPPQSVSVSESKPVRNLVIQIDGQTVYEMYV